MLQEKPQRYQLEEGTVLSSNAVIKIFTVEQLKHLGDSFLKGCGSILALSTNDPIFYNRSEPRSGIYVDRYRMDHKLIRKISRS
jgi:hypothetical protein